jgi:hypothetical protein
MADVTVTTYGFSDEGVGAQDTWVYGTKRIIWTTDTTAYHVYGLAAGDIVYQKTTDGGSTWGSRITISTTAVIRELDIWFDKWTNGDTGTLIHILMNFQAGEITYVSLDTSTDTVGSEVTVATLSSGNVSIGYDAVCASITKSRNGNLYAAAQSSGTAGQKDTFQKSTDSGATWSAKADFIESTDRFILMPGNETDQSDILAMYWDISANEISLKTYDDSGNTWSETSISTGMNERNIRTFNFSATTRHSDNHTILAAWSDALTNNADLKVWDIDTSASITALTNILTASQPHAWVCICINQANDNLYVTYSGESGDSFFAVMSVNWVVSTDNGTTWSAPASVNDATDAYFIWPTCDISVGTYGGKFSVGWVFQSGSGSSISHTIFINIANAVTFGTQAAFLSGTIFGSREEDIRAGGKTLIITLTGLTWDADIGSDNTQTTALINGLDSAQSEGTGWDAVVKAGLTFSNVTRNSDTVVTIAFPAFATYYISAPEVITATIESTSAN